MMRQYRIRGGQASSRCSGSSTAAFALERSRSGRRSVVSSLRSPACQRAGVRIASAAANRISLIHRGGDRHGAAIELGAIAPTVGQYAAEWIERRQGDVLALPLTVGAGGGGACRGSGLLRRRCQALLDRGDR